MWFFLLSCDPYPERPLAALVADELFVSSKGSALCSSEVEVPTGILSVEAPVLATPHVEVYGGAPLPFAVHLGLPSRDPSATISMLWRTDLGTEASVVEIGLAEIWPAGVVHYSGASFLYGSGVVGEGEYRQHEVRLCSGLSPATSYTYRVGGAGAWSEPYTFRTAPAKGSTDAFRVAFLGDSRDDVETWAEVAAAIAASAPDLLVFSGDMVGTGSKQEEWDAWYKASGDLFARVPLIAAHGNHEFLAQNYFAQLGLPGNEEWFAVDWGDALFITLNDTVRNAEEIEIEQPQFLIDELSATRAGWRLTNHHQPVYTVSGSHASREDLRADWAGIWEEWDLDVDVAGHNHTYERSVPIRGGIEDPQGTTYLVSGGAGAPLYTTVEAWWYGAVANPTYHYVLADFSSESADFVVRDLAGNVIDQFQLLP